MSEAAAHNAIDAAPVTADAPRTPPARAALLKRLADVVSLPGSRINAFERSVVGDLLVDMLRLASAGERRRVAERLAPLTDVPNSLTRLLLCDSPDIAGLLIERCAGLSDADLAACIRDASEPHRVLIAQRRGLTEIVSELLIDRAERPVVEALLKNVNARLSQAAVEAAVAMSRTEPSLRASLLKRPELRPSGAYVMFWWCGAEERRVILQRFAVSREVMQEVVEDVFGMAAEEGWQDPVSRKALQFIERRQRNRSAIERSPYASLEVAIADAAEIGLTREVASEISYMSGVKPVTGAKILGDAGGEPLAILCKGTGLTRHDLLRLWRSMRRPEVTPDGEPHPAWERVLTTYEILAVDRAQTVLRYWNWSLSSALTPALMKVIREGGDVSEDNYSTAERAALLALSDNFGA